MYDLPERSNIPSLERPADHDSPWLTVTTAATIQAIAHLCYLGSLLFLLFLLLMSMDGLGRGPDREMIAIFLGSVLVLALGANIVLSLIAAAFMASAEIGSRPRGLGLAILTCTALIVLKLSGALFYPEMMMDRFGGGFGGPSMMMTAGLGMLTLALLELARLSLLGFYISAAATIANKRILASNAHLLGVLVPVIQIALGFLTFIVTMASRSGGSSLVGPMVAMLNFIAHGLLLLFALTLLFRLRGAGSQDTPLRYDD